MDERQPCGVEGQALERDRERLAPPAAVDVVAGDGMTERGEMNPDLVSASRLESHLEERKAAEALEHPVPWHRAPALARGTPRPPHAVARVTADRPVDHALVRAHAAVDDREIPARDASSGELSHERVVA